MKKKILYIDLDGTIANLGKAINKIRPDLDPTVYHPEIDDIFEAHPNIFHDLDPMGGAVDAVMELLKHFDVYFLSTPAWNSPTSFAGKRIWLETHFGIHAEKRLILTHRKDLAIGDYLVDDTKRHGVEEFSGEHIHFGTEEFPDWEVTLPYLISLTKEDFWDGYVTKIYDDAFFGILKRDYKLDKEIEVKIGMLSDKQRSLLSDGSIIKFCVNTHELKFMDNDRSWH